MYSISIRREALKELKQLPKKEVTSINTAIEHLAIDPRSAGCKKLKGQTTDMWRIRVGDYRVLYLIDDVIKIIDVHHIGHRRDVYKK